MKLIWFVFLGIAAGMDVRSREIPVWLYALFGGIGILALVWHREMPGDWSDWGQLASSLGIGIGLLLLGQMTGDAIGAGDGWFFLISGLYLTWQENLGILCYGLLCCSLFGVVFMLWGQWNSISVRKKKLPFLPFLLLPGIWVLCL